MEEYISIKVDILSGVLAGGVFGPKLFSKFGPKSNTGKDAPGKVSHFFGAIRIDAFIEPALFKRSMDEYISTLKNSEKAAGMNRIYIPGEKEFELYEQQKEVVSIDYKVVKELRQIGEELGVKALF